MGSDIKRIGAFIAVLTIALFITAMEESLAFDSGGQVGIKDLKKGVFLIAESKLYDPHFSRSVILILMYEKEGALGLIINRSTDIPLEQALPRLKGAERLSSPVYYGGPVGRNHVTALLRTDKLPEGVKKVFDNIYVTENMRPLIEVIQGPDPEKNVRIYSGYAGWGPGQLDGEVARRDWIIVTADPDIIFSENPSGAWEELYKRGKKIEAYDQTGPDYILSTSHFLSFEKNSFRNMVTFGAITDWQ
jgi:putative transcriptional regulator